MAVRKPIYLNTDAEFQQLSDSDSVNNSDKVDGLHASQFIRSDTNDMVNGNTRWVDNRYIAIGSAEDLKIYHDGSNTFFDTQNGTTYLRFFNGTSYETMASFTPNLDVRLYYNNNLMLRTVSDGVNVEGNIKSYGEISLGSNGIGDSNLSFYDDTNNTYRTLKWDDSESDWRIEDSAGVTQTLYHSGNENLQHSNLTYLNDINQYLGTSRNPTFNGLNLTNDIDLNTHQLRFGNSYAEKILLLDNSTSAKIDYVSSHQFNFHVGHMSSSPSGDFNFYGPNSGSWRRLFWIDGSTGGTNVLGDLTVNGRLYGNDIYLDRSLQVDDQIYIGTSGGGDSLMCFYDDSNTAWRSFYWDDSASDWKIEDSSNSMRTLYHSGNESLQHNNLAYLDDINQYLGTGRDVQFAGLTVQDTANDTVLAIQGHATNDNAELKILESSTLGAILRYDGTSNYLKFIGLSTTENEVARFDRGGSYWIFNDVRISTGNESAPDVDLGGLCLNHGPNDGRVLTFKNSDISHSFTSHGQNDTYAEFRKLDPNHGGLFMATYTEDGETTAECHYGYIYTTFSQPIDSDAQGVFNYVGNKRSGTAGSTMSSTDILATYRNYTSTVFIMRANGAIYNDVNGYGYFDDEDDLMLSETLRNKFADGKPVLKNYEKRLEELGIMENGFVSLSGLASLNLGSIGQIFNIVKNLASRLGISKEELLKIAKES